MEICIKVVAQHERCVILKTLMIYYTQVKNFSTPTSPAFQQCNDELHNKQALITPR